MRAESKVYMDHRDMARVQEAARLSGESLSGFMRRLALQTADELGVPVYRSVLDGQQELIEDRIAVAGLG